MGSRSVNEAGAKLTFKQRTFVAEYLVDYNGTRSAIAAGYSKKGAEVAASKLLANPIIKKILDQVTKRHEEKARVTRQAVLEQLYYLLTKDASEFVDENGRVLNPHRMSKRARSVIDSIKSKVYIDPEGGEHIESEVRTSSKDAAVNLALRYKGLFAPDKLKVTQTGTLDWDSLFKQLAEDPKPDPIEAKFKQLEYSKGNGKPVAKEKSNGQAK